MFLLLTFKGIARRLMRTSSTIAALANGFVKAAVNRRAIWQLSHSDDRLLKDIGLTRSDILAALDEPFFTDPSGNLVRHAGGRNGVNLGGSGDLDGSKRIRCDAAHVADAAGIKSLPMAKFA